MENSSMVFLHAPLPGQACAESVGFAQGGLADSRKGRHLVQPARIDG